MSIQHGLNDKSLTNEEILIKTAAGLLGAAAGGRITSDIIRPTGLPGALATLGGSILGALTGVALAESVKKEFKKN